MGCEAVHNQVVLFEEPAQNVQYASAGFWRWGGDEFRCQGRACEVGNRKGRRRGGEGIGEGTRNMGDAGSGHAGGNATAGGRTTAHVASLHGAAATARRRKGEERRGREAPCVTTRRKEMALVWGGGREQRAEVGGPRRAAAASPLARACSGCRWGGVGRARSGHGVETLCASRSVRPPYRPRRGAGGCWSEQQTKTKASRAQRGYGPAGPL